MKNVRITTFVVMLVCSLTHWTTFAINRYQTPQSDPVTSDRWISMVTTLEPNETVRLEVKARGDFTVEGLQFLETKEVYGEIFHLYKVLQPDIKIKGDVISLHCNYFDLTSLDLSKAPSLQVLSCNANQFMTLNTSNNPELKELHCMEGALESLDLSNNRNLEILNCSTNSLSQLNLSHNTSLKTLLCLGNKLRSLDLSTQTLLEELICSNNQLQTLEVGHLKYLKVLYCDINKLTSLKVDELPALEKLQCAQNPMERFEVNSNSLKEFFITENKLTELILNTPNLELLACYGNQLSTLDLSKCLALNTLSCHTNNLSSLDLSNNASMEYLWVQKNVIEKIDLSHCPAIFAIECYSNRIAQERMAELVNTLPARQKSDEAYIILIDTKDEKEQNECTKQSVAVAKGKNWGVFDHLNNEVDHPGIAYEGKSDNGVAKVLFKEISVYPNPTTDYIYVTLSGNESPEQVIRLFSIHGDLLRNLPLRQLGNGLVSIDIRYLPDGKYVLCVAGQSKLIDKRS